MTHAWRKRHYKPAGECPAAFLHVKTRSLDLGEDAAAVLQKPLAGLGQGHSPPITLKQHLPEFDL
jgi:hypothetical protein